MIEEIKENVNLTIHKQNTLIRGEFAEYDLHTIKCLNSLYWMIQKNLPEIKDKKNKFKMELKSLRKLMGLEKINQYNDIINDSLKKLQEPFTVHNYVDSSGEHWDLKNISLIRETGIRKGFQHEYVIEVHPDLIDVIGHTKNWTELEFSIVQKFNSKYSIRLYEYLKSYSNMKKTPDMNLEDLNRVFLTEYKHLSKVEEVIKRCLKDLEDTDIDITYIKDKKKKTIIFNIKINGSLEEQKKAIKINKSIQSKSKNEQDIIERIMNED